MISEDDIQKAVDYLRDSAVIAAQARANRLYLEAWIKTVKAQEMAKSDGKTVSERENDAYQAALYIDALKGFRDSVELDEKHRFLREAASAKIEAWRTMQANERAASRV